MAKIFYVPKKFTAVHLEVIERADEILTQYAEAGYTMTLRQVFYQFVSRDWLPNRQTEYKRLGDMLANARLAGLIDWTMMEDRTRNVRTMPHWDDPSVIVNAAAQGFRIDKWKAQDNYVECWVEKDALIGVLQVVCERNDVPYFSCRGYTSQSEVWGAAMRLLRAGRPDRKAGRLHERNLVILHLGDHDPSGIDMTRDLEERLALFCCHHGGPAPEVRRLALNMPQVQEYSPPPNPMKSDDPRARGYFDAWGDESWELDALEPTVLDALIQEAIDELRDDAQWAYDAKLEAEDRQVLETVARRWEEVHDFIAGDAA